MRVYSFGSCDGFPDVLEAPAFLIEDGNELILVDCPPHINLMLKQIGKSVMDVTGIILTHLHNDHTGGLIDFIQMRMVCLSKPRVMRESGYFTKVARRNLNIWVYGEYFGGGWLDSICDLINYNCPRRWKSWSEHHTFVSIPPLTGRAFKIGETSFECRKTLHDVSAVGLRINDKVAISGDTPFDVEYLDWLIEGSDLVFHEFGYAGSHTTEEHVPKILASHPNVKLYHMPYPVKEKVQKMNDSPVLTYVAQRRWYEV